jgi:hypothetical protein
MQMRIIAIKVIVAINVPQESAKLMCMLEAASLQGHVVAAPASAHAALVIG